ncbi:MAG: S8 family serine peptidase [Flavobacteriaceae bacterium]
MRAPATLVQMAAAILLALPAQAMSRTEAIGLLPEMCKALAGGLPPTTAQLGAAIGTSVDSLEHRAAGRSIRYLIRLDAESSVDAVVLGEGAYRSLRFVVAQRRSAGERPVPHAMVLFREECRDGQGSQVEYGGDGKPKAILTLQGPNLLPVGREDLNPPIPRGADPGGVTVAQVDTGVDYLQPRIARQIARDGDGKPVAFDFTDDDGLPYDTDPARDVLFAKRHGTYTASILLTEAPQARLVPIRIPPGPGPDYGRIVDTAAQVGARILLMPLGTYKREDWTDFAAALGRHPDMLAVVSAGNEGRDIDAEPVFPAALSNDNLLVVTSTLPDGALARESNWGGEAVDVAVPAEKIVVLGPQAKPREVSGTSFAAPRVAALAVRLAAAHPDWTARELKEAIAARALALADSGRPIRFGHIPHPERDE